MKKHIHENYECGCWYELLEENGEVLVLRMTTCSLCMSMAWMRLDDLLTEKSAQLSLTDHLASSGDADKESQDDHTAPQARSGQTRS